MVVVGGLRCVRVADFTIWIVHELDFIEMTNELNTY